MTISEICIKRPVFTWVLMAIPIVLGSLSYARLGVDLFPNVDFPVCAVVAALPGASVEEMESTVTKPIEDAINQISGIDELRSTSREGSTVIVIQFDLSKDLDVGAQEVRDKVGATLAALPDGMEPPVVSRFGTDEIPVLTLAISGRRDLREVTEIARKRIKERIETVNGVGTVWLQGSQVRAMNVIVNRDQLAAYNLSIEDVRTALLRQSVEVPGGRIDQGSQELTLRTLGRIDTAAEFNDLIITNRNGYPIRIRDIGRAEDSNEEVRSLARLDFMGDDQPPREAVSLVVQKQSGVNVVALVDELNKRLDQIKKDLPPDIEIVATRDLSRFVRKSIEEVQFHMLLAAVLVSATIFLFIRDWRTTVIATLAVPCSIIPTFAFMSVMDYTLNNITILGLILAIGVVIDDAIVVHENIFRHMEENGLDGYEAARVGTREIALPVLATSLSLIVIFLPIGFMGGIIGKFFSSFGLTVAFAVAMSLFVSFTLTPMLCSRFLKLDRAHDPSQTTADRAKSKAGFVYRLIDGGYGWLLRKSLRFKPLVLLLTVLTIASTVPIAGAVGFSLIPRDDQSEFEVAVITPEGYTLDRTNLLLRELEDRIARLPEIDYIYTTVGGIVAGGQSSDADVTRGSLYVRLNELGHRTNNGISQFAVQDQAREILKDYPDVRSSVNDVSPFQGGGERGQTFQVNIAGPDLAQLEKLAQTLKGRLQDSGMVTDADTSLSLRKPEVQVVVDRERASDLSIPVGVVADTLRVLVGGLRVSKFRDGPEQYDVWLRANRDDRSSREDLLQLTIPSPRADQVRLANVARLREDVGPTEIERLNRERIVTVLANPKGDIALGSVVSLASQVLDNEMEMPPGYRYIFTGQADTLAELGYYFFVAFFLATTFMYLILAAQFESWTQPMAILMSLPVTAPFGLLSMVLFRTPMDLYAMFGLFMLIGIVKKNGILQIDATNQHRAAGADRETAIIEANHLRLRPILMTTFMLVAAMIPLALGQGPGSGSRASMAKLIIGGQSLSLVLALIVVPVFYVYLDQIVSFMRRKGIRLSVDRRTQPPTPSSSPPSQPPAPPKADLEPAIAATG